MAHFATKRFNYWGQLGVLTAFCGVGLIVGGILSLVPLLGILHLKDLAGGSSTKVMTNLMVPANATAVRWMQFISTLFLFFLPPFFYALVCHQKPSLHLGFKHKVNLPQIVIIVLVMLACMPLIDSLQQITLKFPWSKATLLRFDLAEQEYNKEISVIARMDNFSDYIIAMIMVAFLPAVFEETLFRGGLQNLLSRWFKKPILAIIVTSIIFSAIHGSYLGFLSRVALSVILGWIYYRTGNLWLSAIAHFFNNGFGITALYFSTKPGEKLDPTKFDAHLPLWMGLVSIAAIYGLFTLFEKASKDSIDRPGQEVLINDYIDTNNPFLADIENIGHTDQPHI